MQYIAPEVLEGSHPTAASDVWGIGVTLWAAAHGRAPFGAEGEPLATIVASAMNGMPHWDPPFGHLGPEGERLREIVELCTNPEPGDRPSAAEIRSLAMRNVTSSALIPAPAAPKRRSPFMALCALLTTLAVLGGAVALRNDGRAAPRLLNSTPKDWCMAVSSAAIEVGRAIDRASTQIVTGQYSATAVRSALRELPIGINAATQPWRKIIAIEPTFDSLVPALTESRLQDFVIAETVTHLATGEFIETAFARSLSHLPGSILATQRALARVSAESMDLCGTEAQLWRDQQLHLIDVVKMSLEGPGAPFFADPTSPLVLDTPLLTVIIAVQENYFVDLVSRHPGWLIGATSSDGGSTAIRELMLHKGAHAFRRLALDSEPIAQYLARDNRILFARLLQTIDDDTASRQFLDDVSRKAGLSG